MRSRIWDRSFLSRLRYSSQLFKFRVKFLIFADNQHYIVKKYIRSIMEPPENQRFTLWGPSLTLAANVHTWQNSRINVLDLQSSKVK